MKKHFLLTTLPTNDLGLITRSLPIARRLKDNGHTITFSNPARSPRKVIEDAGFENVIPPHPFYELSGSSLSIQSIHRTAKSNEIKLKYGGSLQFYSQLLRSIPFRFAKHEPDVWDMDHAAAMTGMLNSNFIYSQCLAHMRVIEHTCPDVIIDFWNPFATIAAKKLEIPIITINQADAHPASKGFIWWNEKPKHIPSCVPAVNKTLRKLKLETVNKLEDLNVGDLTLIVGTPLTDPLPDGTNYEHIGPVIWEKEDQNLPEKIIHLSKDLPVIWLYSGNPKYANKTSLFDSDIILDACIKILKDVDVQVVLTTGHHPLPQSCLPLPSNFIHHPYVPGLKMAARADLLIHHGGYGSCQTGLFTGTPSLIIPTFSERESNARRIAALGAGEFVLPTCQNKKRKIDLDELKHKLIQMLTTESYTQKANDMQVHLQQYGGAERAVQLIEQFLAKH